MCRFEPARSTPLDELTTALEGEIGGMPAQSRMVLWEQVAGFRSCLPDGVDELLVHRNLDTTSVATMFPFSSLSLSMENGVLYGISHGTNIAGRARPVRPQPRERQPGRLRQERGRQVVLLQADGAAQPVRRRRLRRHRPRGRVPAAVRAAGGDGQYFRLSSSSGQHLNPFDLPPPDATDAECRDPLAEQVTEVLGCWTSCWPSPARACWSSERAVLDTAIYETYARAGITADPATHGRPAPLLRDFAAVLGGNGG